MKSRILRRTVLKLMAMIITLLALTSAHAQQEYIDQLVVQLELNTEALAQIGYRGVLGDGGALDDQTFEDYTVTLSAGSDYVISGVCDEDCFDLDLALYDSAGDLVTADETEDDQPVVEFRVTRGGPFTLRATMYECHADPCYYALGLYER